MDVKLYPANDEIPKSTYVVTVDTMQGDADDYHEFEIHTQTLEELREIIIGMQILCNTYPNGGGGEYCGEFYKNYVAEDLHYDCNSDWHDSIQSFVVNYFDEQGNKFYVKYTPDEEMQNRIDACDGLTPKEIKQMELPVLTPENKELIQIMFDKVAQDFKNKLDNSWTYDQYPDWNNQPDYKTNKSYVLNEMFSELLKKMKKVTNVPREYFDKLTVQKGINTQDEIDTINTDDDYEMDDE